MSKIAGDAKLITVGDRSFEGGGPINCVVGGVKKDVLPTGNGGKLYKVERLPWSITGVKLPCDIIAGELVYLQNIASSTEDVACGFELQDGTAMTGTGSIVGEVQYNGDTGMAEFDMKGVGTLEVM
jgi:hypothetical protein